MALTHSIFTGVLSMKVSWAIDLRSIWLVSVLMSLCVNVFAKDEFVIEKGRTVSIEYVLTLDDGSVASTNEGQGPLTYVHGSEQILTNLELALQGLKSGDVKKVSLTADDGYGSIDPNAFVSVPIDLIPEDARTPGTTLVGHDASGSERPVRVHEVLKDKIVIDQNHPLAGKNLHFKITILSVN